MDETLTIHMFYSKGSAYWLLGHLLEVHSFYEADQHLNTWAAQTMKRDGQASFAVYVDDEFVYDGIYDLNVPADLKRQMTLYLEQLGDEDAHRLLGALAQQNPVELRHGYIDPDTGAWRSRRRFEEGQDAIVSEVITEDPNVVADINAALLAGTIGIGQSGLVTAASREQVDTGEGEPDPRHIREREALRRRERQRDEQGRYQQPTWPPTQPPRRATEPPPERVRERMTISEAHVPDLEAQLAEARGIGPVPIGFGQRNEDAFVDMHEGVAKAIWANAWMAWHDEEEIPQTGVDFYHDAPVTYELELMLASMADRFIAEIEDTLMGPPEGPWEEFERSDAYDPNNDRDSAEQYGYNLLMEALGHGVSWEDESHHPPHNLPLPHVELNLQVATDADPDGKFGYTIYFMDRYWPPGPNYSIDMELGEIMEPYVEPHDPVGERRIVTSYEIVTPESAEEGDFAETGWEDEEGYVVDGEIGDAGWDQWVNDACGFLHEEGPLEPSNSSFYPGTWYTQSDPEQGIAYFERGEERRQSYHLKGFTDTEESAIYKVVTGLSTRMSESRPGIVIGPGDRRVLIRDNDVEAVIVLEATGDNAFSVYSDRGALIYSGIIVVPAAFREDTTWILKQIVNSYIDDALIGLGMSRDYIEKLGNTVPFVDF